MKTATISHDNNIISIQLKYVCMTDRSYTGFIAKFPYIGNLDDLYFLVRDDLIIVIFNPISSIDLSRCFLSFSIKNNKITRTISIGGDEIGKHIVKYYGIHDVWLHASYNDDTY